MLSAEVDQALFAALKAKRRALAEAQGVPPYIIFHDRTLLEMARLRPCSLEEMAGISGIGQHKLERYGRTFLEILENAGQGVQVGPAS